MLVQVSRGRRSASSFSGAAAWWSRRLQGFVDHLMHERGFARARHAGNHRQQPQRNRYVYAFEVVQPGAFETQDLAFVHVPPVFAASDVKLVTKVLRGERSSLIRHEFGEIAFER